LSESRCARPEKEVRPSRSVQEDSRPRYGMCYTSMVLGNKVERLAGGGFASKRSFAGFDLLNAIDTRALGIV
jgi:hypothetical protein